MSSPAQGGPSGPSTKRRGLGKLVSRMKTLVRRPRRQQGKHVEPGPPAREEDAADETALVPLPADTPSDRRALAPVDANAKPVARAHVFEERAKKLAERHGLELSPSPWHATEGQVLRVERPIKTRVHRRCHACQARGTTTSFGLARACPVCGHARCKQCPRVPPRRTDEEREVGRQKRAAAIQARAETAPIACDWDLGEKKVVLRRPAKAGSQDLVYRKARQRVRRYCCQVECQSLFVGGSKQCAHCGHQRCTDCPRGPAKSGKYPYGYPGDVLSEKLGYFACSHCIHVYAAHPYAEAECPQCRSRKDDSHTRQTPRKVEPEPDPELWQAVQARLEALQIR